MNEQNNQPRRSLLRMILPYLLIVLAIGAFVGLVILRNKSGVTQWNSDVSTLDKAFKDNEIFTAEVYRKDQIVEVSGKYVESGQTTIKQYTLNNNH